MNRTSAGAPLLRNALLLISFLTPVSLANTIYVDGVNGNDAWDGLCEDWDGWTCGPKATIQAGVDAAVNLGDVVIVADAIYAGPGNMVISFHGRAITVRSKNGPENCIVDCQSATDPAFGFVSGEGPTSVLDGITVKNCYGC